VRVRKKRWGKRCAMCEQTDHDPAPMDMQTASVWAAVRYVLRACSSAVSDFPLSCTRCRLPTTIHCVLPPRSTTDNAGMSHKNTIISRLNSSTRSSTAILLYLSWQPYGCRWNCRYLACSGLFRVWNSLICWIRPWFWVQGWIILLGPNILSIPI
jgi:hypothetical protein